LSARKHSFAPILLTRQVTVNKFLYAALSLIAAVPGGILGFLLLKAAILDGHFRDMAGLMKAVVVAVFGLSAVLTVIPLGILLFVRGEKEEAAEDEAELDEDEEEPPEAEAEVEEAEAADVEEAVEGETEMDEDEEPTVRMDEPTEAQATEASVVIEPEEDSADIYEADEEPDEKPKE